MVAALGDATVISVCLLLLCSGDGDDAYGCKEYVVSLELLLSLKRWSVGVLDMICALCGGWCAFGDVWCASWFWVSCRLGFAGCVW